MHSDAAVAQRAEATGRRPQHSQRRLGIAALAGELDDLLADVGRLQIDRELVVRSPARRRGRGAAGRRRARGAAAEESATPAGARGRSPPRRPRTRSSWTSTTSPSAERPGVGLEAAWRRARARSGTREGVLGLMGTGAPVGEGDRGHGSVWARGSGEAVGLGSRWGGPGPGDPLPGQVLRRSESVILAQGGPPEGADALGVTSIKADCPRCGARTDSVPTT